MSQRTCVISRAVGPADRQALLGLFARSSQETRRDRFHHALSVFPQRYLDEILTGRQLAVAARDVCHEDRREQLFGLASAAPTGPGTAEFAVWVEDAWQGCGVGSLLVRAILHLLAEQGFSTAIGVIEPGNFAVRRLVNRIAPDTATRTEDGMVVVSIPLRSSAVAARDLPHPHRVYPHADSSSPHWTAGSAPAGWPAYERTRT